MSVLATTGADAHSILIWVLGSLAALAVGALIRLAWRGGNAVAKIVRFVLPHFEPPTEAEIRAGKDDITLPARMKAQEERLALHLTTEEGTTDRLNTRLQRIEEGLGLTPGEKL